MKANMQYDLSSFDRKDSQVKVMVPEVSNLEPAPGNCGSPCVLLIQESNTNLVDRMQSDQLPWNVAGHVIPSDFSN